MHFKTYVAAISWSSETVKMIKYKRRIHNIKEVQKLPVIYKNFLSSTKTSCHLQKLPVIYKNFLPSRIDVKLRSLNLEWRRKNTFNSTKLHFKYRKGKFWILFSNFFRYYTRILFKSTGLEKLNYRKKKLDNALFG